MPHTGATWINCNAVTCLGLGMRAQHPCRRDTVLSSRSHFDTSSTSIGTCSTLPVYLPGHPCRRCFGKSQQTVLYQWTTWLRPLSRGKQGGSQLSIRCSSPLQPDASGLLQTAFVTDRSKSLKVSIMALVRDHVNMMWRICNSGGNISVSAHKNTSAEGDRFK